METLKLNDLLGHHRRKTIRFSEFIDTFLEKPNEYLQTSSTLIMSAIRFFGFEIVIRNGEPVISYNIFKDIFTGGINAVFGQEQCIKHMIEIIESIDHEAGLNRGIILVGPPASGKTNIVDLIIKALEEYTKENVAKIYSFYFKFPNDKGCPVEIRSRFQHNPILLVPIRLKSEDGKIIRPRQSLFDYTKRHNHQKEQVVIPNFYQNATLDKRTLDILEGVFQNPVNKNKSYYEILEEYVRVEEIELSTAQAKGISNIDDTSRLRTSIGKSDLGPENMKIVAEHLPGQGIYQYDGAIVDSNRGILHIHDAFGNEGGIPTKDYKPLLMLLGSGKVSIESTQASVDNTVIVTTNISEMEYMDNQKDASKLLDRIEKVPVNYLLDANSEMDILRRDMANLRDQYDLDPNLLRIAAYYSVLSRLLPPSRKKFPENWSEEKQTLFTEITPEQKLMIYASQNEDSVKTIQELPHWHPFRNEMLRFGFYKSKPETFSSKIVNHPDAINLRESELFATEELKLIDDEFMRVLWNEHFPNEGKTGISVRQLQNIMRNTIAHSDGIKIHVGIFLKQLGKVVEEGPRLHHWLYNDYQTKKSKVVLKSRKIGDFIVQEGVGGYGDYQGLVEVVKYIYYSILKKEVTECTVDRDPVQIESDLRKYVQQALLFNALQNKAFSHIMVPKFAYIDPVTGDKVDEPDESYMDLIERILSQKKGIKKTRKEIIQKFLDLQSGKDLAIEDGKNLVSSKNDNFISCFAKEYSLLLSHRKVEDNIDPEKLYDAFFIKKNNNATVNQVEPQITEFMLKIIDNMVRRYGYSSEIALDTIVFALRKKIINFKKILC